MTASLIVEVEKPVYGGDCLAHLPATQSKPGKAVFVPLTLPGESVKARVTEDKRNFVKAELEEILRESPGRVAPGCRHFGTCGGCQYQHADYPAQLAWKQQILRETLLRAGVPIPSEIGILAANAWAYRNRIRLAIAPDGKPGYRGRRSHAIVPIEQCPIAAPVLLETAERFAGFWNANPSYAQVSELELFTNPSQSELLLTLSCRSAPSSNPQGWLEDLYTALASLTTGIRLQLSENSLGPKTLAAAGKPSLNYPAAGAEYRVDHGAFFQVNRWLVDEFTALVTGGSSGRSAWDLFAGVGLFARQLGQSFDEVTAVESAPASTAALEFNLAATGGRAVAATTIDFLQSNRAERQPAPDLILLDPPRAGLGEETTSLLNAIGAPDLVYVSCDPETLARDLRALTQERYRIYAITLADMFPQTFHIETVVRLHRS